MLGIGMEYDLFAIFLFYQPFIPNLVKGKTGGNRRRGEEMRRG